MKKQFALLLTAALMAGTLSACGNSATPSTSATDDGTVAPAADAGSDTPEDAPAAASPSSNEGEIAEDGTPIITFFDKNSGTRTFDDPVALELMKRTGVTLNLVSPTGDPGEKLSLMLAGQD